MSKKANLEVRIDKKTKRKAEKILKGLGMTMSQAVNLLAHQIVIRQGFPISLNLEPGSACGGRRQTVLHGAMEQAGEEKRTVHKPIVGNDEE